MALFMVNLVPGEQVMASIRREQGTAMGGQADNHSAPRALASPGRKDKVRSVVVEAGLWRFRGSTAENSKKLWPGAL